MIRTSFALGFGQLKEPRFRQTALIGAALSLVLLFAIYAVLIQIFAALDGESFAFSDGTRMDRLGAFFSFVSIATMLMLSVFLMAPVASLLTGLHLHAVASEVEKLHYPAPGPVMPQGTYKLWYDSINYFGLMLAINLASFFSFAIFGMLWGIVIFWALNGWLLSREYVTMIAERRLDRASIKALRRQHRQTFLLAGVVFAVLLSVPFVNLLMPVIGIAAFTHLAHALTTHLPEGTPP